LVLGNLGSLTEESKGENANVVVHAQTAVQSNLSLLLQNESNNSLPPETSLNVQQSQSIILDGSSAQIDDSKTPDVTKSRILIDNNNELETDEMENRPLLNNQLGFNSNYGNVITEDISKSINYDIQSSLFGLSKLSIHLTPKKVVRYVILDPISYIPAVILGLLLNLLDAISYGKID
jgi:hypothetical protein